MRHSLVRKELKNKVWKEISWMDNVNVSSYTVEDFKNKKHGYTLTVYSNDNVSNEEIKKAAFAEYNS